MEYILCTLFEGISRRNLLRAGYETGTKSSTLLLKRTWENAKINEIILTFLGGSEFININK